MPNPIGGGDPDVYCVRLSACSFCVGSFDRPLHMPLKTKIKLSVSHKGAGVVATPHGFLPRDSHEISPTIGGGTQVDDFNKGFSKGFFDKILRRRNGGGQGDPDPLVG